MKICFITSTVFTLGGVQRVVSVLANELSKKHEIDILCTSDNSLVNREIYGLNENIKINIEPNLWNENIKNRIIKKINKETNLLNKKRYVSILTNEYYNKKTQQNFVEYINSKKYDVVIGVEGKYSILLGIISDKLNCKTIGWQHNSYDAYMKNKKRYYWNQDILFEEYIPRLDKYLVLTEYDQKMFLQEKNIKSSVMYNPRSFKSKDKSKVNKKQFLAAGRFKHQKGFDLLIESFYEFCKYDKEWNLVIVGEGEDKEKILNLIDKYGLEKRVKIDNFTNDIKNYFMNSSVLTLSSRWEGMPMIVLESLEMGVPIISYDITATQQLIEDKKEGLLVNKYDTIKFAEAMKIMADSQHLREEMSKNAINKSTEFDIENIAKQWNEMFLEIVN